MRETGILMPVSSLPSRTGVGELGKETYTFLDILKEAGVKIWQVLPMNPLGYGNSPYQPYSSCAGDELYISLGLLYEEGLLKELPPSHLENAKKVEYEKVRAWKEGYLREAFENFQETEEYHEFISEEWVRSYGVFRALKKENENRCWNEWREEHKNWKGEALSEETEKEASYHMFLQYVFLCQWKKIKEYANKNGIRIMGDVPFYVGIDSVDVWAGKENFLLGADGRPTFIAGVPPDYFSAVGQRWGNPVYDWEYLKKTGYDFWVKRIGYNSRLFDLIRIDHFRAFDTFWKIPASCPTAVEGEWIEAPGYEVLDTLKREVPEAHLVAEDLGDLRPEVLTLKDHYGLKGMKILQFSIDTKGKYARDTFEEKENLIIYTGTHDNDTIMEWYGKMSCAAKRKIRRFLKKQGIKTGSVKDRLLAYTWRSRAEYAIIPAADILGLGKEAHLNTPGTVGSPNWEWRMTDMKRLAEELYKYKKQMTER